EIAVRSPLAVSRLPRGDREVADDPLDRDVVEDRAMNEEPVFQPALRAAAALAIAEGQVAPFPHADRPARAANRLGDPLEDVPLGHIDGRETGGRRLGQ